jgi:hypothetical protein
VTDVNLLQVAAVAFLAVFMLLGALAALMHGLTLLFPAPTDEDDAAMLTAIVAAAAAAYPEMRVAGIEEKR